MTTATGQRFTFKEITKEGGFPTEEEFEQVWMGLETVEELGFDRLFRRIAKPIVDAYEAAEETRIPLTYENLGLLKAKTDTLVEEAERILERAKRLSAIASDVGLAIENGGKIEHSPEFDEDGAQYVPSPAAFARWTAQRGEGERDG